MSVFTPVTRPELETFLAPYELGRLLDFQGIAAGTENSNFFVSLEQGEFVLTLIELTGVTGFGATNGLVVAGGAAAVGDILIG